MTDFIIPIYIGIAIVFYGMFRYLLEDEVKTIKEKDHLPLCDITPDQELGILIAAATWPVTLLMVTGYGIMKLFIYVWRKK